MAQDMSQVKSSKQQVKRSKLLALKQERAALREKVTAMGRMIDFLTAKVRVKPGEPFENLPTLIIEAEYMGKVYQGTLDHRTFNDNRIPEQVCQQFGIVSASQLMGGRMAALVGREALKPLIEMLQTIRAKDPQTDAFSERKAG